MAQANKGSSVQHTHPLLYWVTIAYIVGVPNFLQFDTTGRTHDFGLFNVTSISRIALTLVTGYVLIINLVLGRGPIFPRKVKVSISVWVSLLVWCTISTILQPPSRLSPPQPTDLPLSLFRLGEWILAFVLLLALYTREPAETATALVIEIIGRASWITVLMVWIAWPFAPNLVYGITGEPGSVALLGGVFVIPATLAFQAGCACVYALFFLTRSYYRWLGCSLCVVTMLLTRARTPLIGFVVALGCYALIYPRKAVLRWATAALLVALASALAVFSKPIEAYFAKGQDSSTIASLDGKVPVWQACWSAIQQHPIFGYGYVIGARNAIRDHWLDVSQWIPPHAHNDLIQAALQAGLPAFLILTYVYILLIVRCIKSARISREHLFLFLVVIQLTIIATTGLVLSYTFNELGAAMILCYLALSPHDNSHPDAAPGMTLWQSTALTVSR
jgi:O-antigen ligase